MTFDPTRGDRKVRDDLVFKTIDGNDIGMDVIIAYRIDPSKAPYILQYVARNDRLLREKVVRTVSRSKPRDIFGELKTEEFYVADKREAKAQDAKEVLQEILGPMGIIVERVLTKDYRFNPEYQKAIEDKKIADQRVEKNRSAQHAALEEYKRKLEETRRVRLTSWWPTSMVSIGEPKSRPTPTLTNNRSWLRQSKPRGLQKPKVSVK